MWHSVIQKTDELDRVKRTNWRLWTKDKSNQPSAQHNVHKLGLKASGEGAEWNFGLQVHRPNALAGSAHSQVGSTVLQTSQELRETGASRRCNSRLLVQQQPVEVYSVWAVFGPQQRCLSVLGRLQLRRCSLGQVLARQEWVHFEADCVDGLAQVCYLLQFDWSWDIG